MLAPLHLARIRSRRVFLILGGPVASFTIASLATLAALSAPAHFWQPFWELLCMISAISVNAFVINLMPLKPDHSYSDGAKVAQLMKNGPWAGVDFVSSMVAASLVTSARPRDWNIDAIREVCEFLPKGHEGMRIRLCASMYSLDSGETDQALFYLQDAEEACEHLRKSLSADFCAEFVFLNAILQHDTRVAERWWALLNTHRNV